MTATAYRHILQVAALSPAFLLPIHSYSLHDQLLQALNTDASSAVATAALADHCQSPA
jgi:hypothetical protein